MKITREGEAFYPEDACDGVEEKIISMQMGLLSDSEEKILMEHIETCEACRALHEFEEMIKEGYRFYFETKETSIPTKPPKKIRIAKTKFCKQQLISRLQELGNTILFQQSDICDMIRPWSEPKPIKYCTRMLNNTCVALLKDPYVREVGLKPDFIEDCHQFLNDLVNNPTRFFNVESAKEALDRSISVEPDHILSIKSLSDYYLFRLDYQSTIDECKRLLNLGLELQQKYRIYLNLSSNMINTKKYSDALQYLDMAESISPDFRLYFMKFKLHFLGCYYNASESRIESIIDNMARMDSLIDSSETDSESVSVTAKWIDKIKHDLLRFSAHDPTISRLTNKYAEMILDR